MAIIDKVLKRFDTPTLSRDTARTQQDLAAVDRQIANLVTAIAQGQGLAPLLDALKARQTTRDALAATMPARTARMRSKVRV